MHNIIKYLIAAELTGLVTKSDGTNTMGAFREAVNTPIPQANTAMTAARERINAAPQAFEDAIVTSGRSFDDALKARKARVKGANAEYILDIALLRLRFKWCFSV